jgi:UDP-glucuronate decarboxylase
MMRNPVIQEDVEMIVRADLPWSAFQGRTVLVSGANGFLPAYIVETLLHLNDARRYGITVIGLVRNEERARARFAYATGRKDLKFIVQDVVVPLPYPGTIDYIIHAASPASPKYFGRDPAGTVLANTQGTLNMLALGVEKKVKSLLFFSSGEVYGQVDPTKIPIKENDYGYVDPTDIRSCYAEGKRAGETMCIAWHYQYGVPAKIVRPFHTYGPGMHLNDGRVFADFVRDIVQGHDIIMKSEGRTVRPFCYLGDATAGFFTVLLKGEDANAYNIGNDKAEISIAELADTLVRLFPERKLHVVRQNRNPDQGYLESPISRNCPDISKVSRLGWTPSTTVEAGFARTIRSYA